MFRSSASSDRLDWESNDENFGERFILGSAWLLITLTDWNCGILGRAPVEFKELVVADFDGDWLQAGPLLVLALTSLPFTMFVLLWLWLMELFDGVSRLRKCLKEKGFSLGASVEGLKSIHNKTEMTIEKSCTIFFRFFTWTLAAICFPTKAATFPTICDIVCVQFILILVFVSH